MSPPHSTALSDEEDVECLIFEGAASADAAGAAADAPAAPAPGGGVGSSEGPGRADAPAAAYARDRRAAPKGDPGDWTGATSQPRRKRAPCTRVSARSVIEQLEQQVQDKKAELEVLQTENAQLKQRDRVLSRAVAGRNSQIGILQGLTRGGSGRCATSSDDTNSGLGAAAAASTPDSQPPEAAPRPASAAGVAAAAAAGPRPGCTRRWWHGDGRVTAAELAASTPEDVRELLGEFTDGASRALLALEKEEAGWWAGGGRGGRGGAAGAQRSSAEGGAPGQQRSCPWAPPGAASGRGAADAATPDAKQTNKSAACRLSMAATEMGGLAGAATLALEADDGGCCQAEGGAGAEGGEAASSFFYYGGSAALPEGVAPGGALARIYSLVNRYFGAMKHIHLACPSVLIPLMGTNMETGEPVSVPDSYWRGVVARLGLTEGQRADMLAMWELYETQRDSLLEERARLQAQLAAMAGALAARQQPDCSLQSIDSTIVPEMELSSALRANMTREHTIRSLLYSLVFDCVLTPVQLARMGVYAWPLSADAYAVIKVVVEEAAAAAAAEAKPAAAAAPGPFFGPFTGPAAAALGNAPLSR